MDTGLPSSAAATALAAFVLATAAGAVVLMLMRRVVRSREPTLLLRKADDATGQMVPGEQDVAARTRRSSRVQGVLDMAWRHLDIYRSLQTYLPDVNPVRLERVLERMRSTEQLADDFSYLTVGDPTFLRAARSYLNLDQACAREVTAMLAAGRLEAVPARLAEVLPDLESAVGKLREAAEHYVNGTSTG